MTAFSQILNFLKTRPNYEFLRNTSGHYPYFDIRNRGVTKTPYAKIADPPANNARLHNNHFKPARRDKIVNVIKSLIKSVTFPRFTALMISFHNFVGGFLSLSEFIFDKVSPRKVTGRNNLSRRHPDN